MTFRNSFETFLEKIKPNIKNYLEEKGYDTSTAIKCLNPEHNDTNPSMVISKAEENDWTAWCLSCGWRADIFDAYATLENKPRKGPGWMKEVVLPLAKKYQVPPPTIELSGDEQFRHDLYRTYEQVASLLHHDPHIWEEGPASYVREHKWTDETLNEYDIGCLTYERLQKAISSEDRERFGLDRPDVFNKENLLFTHRDSFGRAVRFFARRFGDSRSKFQSTTSAKLQVDVWGGHGHLYLSHLLDRKTTSVTLVEGQSDAITLVQSGLKGIVALCGCRTFSEAHADQLALAGVTQVTIFYDGDEAGRTGIQKLLDKDFVKSGALSYSISLLPEGEDPDTLLRTRGVDNVRHLLNGMRVSSFEYLLSIQNPEGDLDTICRGLVPYIAASKSEISREQMARELAKFFNNEVSIAAILSDVRRADKAVANAALERQRIIVNMAGRQAQENVEQATEIFRSAIGKIEDDTKATSPYANTKVACLNRIQSCKVQEERKVKGGFKLSEGRLQSLADILGAGDWAGGKFIIVGAIQNMGKSSFVNDLVWQIISNPDNNAIGFIQSLDDAAEAVIRRLACNAYGDPSFTQNMVANPHRYAEELGQDWVYEAREIGYAKLTEMVAEGRLIIRDASDGRTVAYAESQIQQIRRENPEANIVWAADNFHNLDDFPMMDPRTKFTNICHYIKRVAEIYKVTAICTAEYRKGDESKPGSDDDLAECRSLKFDPHLTLHLFSDTHSKGAEDALLVHNFKGELRPRVLVSIGKNKISSFKGKGTKGALIYDFHPASGMFYSVDKEKARMEYKIRQMELKNKYNEAEGEEAD